jgi:S-adenosylmethionine:tRNA ribosyltransferase-isomerase
MVLPPRDFESRASTNSAIPARDRDYAQMNPLRQPKLTLADFDYSLPAELIAQHPAAERTASRLLRLTRAGLGDHLFRELPRFFERGDLLVCNDTRVIKARLSGRKESGGRIEVLIERLLSTHEALAQVHASHAPQRGMRLILADAIEAVVVGRDGDLFHLRLENAASVEELLERFGAVPLPPYIAHPAEASDAARYQTVYAAHPGAVAAPTAGLHFDATLLGALRESGVEIAFLTLHVGAGTFQPVRTEDIAAHRMHRERYDIPAQTAAAVRHAKAAGRSVIAVGTTSLRALEAHAATHDEGAAGAGDTDLFITPGYRFRVVDRLITNFHLPRSTLLMLVAAFAGMEPIRRAYEHAIAARYRFFSYGDAMLIDRMAE